MVVSFKSEILAGLKNHTKHTNTLCGLIFEFVFKILQNSNYTKLINKGE
jgi:hypothetical protein